MAVVRYFSFDWSSPSSMIPMELASQNSGSIVSLATSSKIGVESEQMALRAPSRHCKRKPRWCLNKESNLEQSGPISHWLDLASFLLPRTPITPGTLRETAGWTELRLESYSAHGSSPFSTLIPKVDRGFIRMPSPSEWSMNNVKYQLWFFSSVLSKGGRKFSKA